MLPNISYTGVVIKGVVIKWQKGDIVLVRPCQDDMHTFTAAAIPSEFVGRVLYTNSTFHTDVRDLSTGVRWTVKHESIVKVIRHPRLRFFQTLNEQKRFRTR